MKRIANSTDVAFALFALAVAICSTAVAFPVMQPSTGPYAANPNPPEGHAIGPKQVLTGLIKRITPDSRPINLTDAEVVKLLLSVQESSR